jgi:hypothetical protein
MSTSSSGVRHRGFADFNNTEPERIEGRRHWLMRGQNFWVEWVETPSGAEPFTHESAAEALLITDATPLRVEGAARGAGATDVPAHAVCILPAGRHMVSATAGSYVLIASERQDLEGRRVLNEHAYLPADPRIRPAGRPYRRNEHRSQVEVLGIDAIKASADRPRLKMLQTETLSINVVEYTGVRDRTALSPHSHADFEQGSLAIAGDFVHHLRVPWGPNANQWRDDEHLAASSPSLLVVPVEMVHTTEGSGEGRHLLIDVFSPPRGDFIDKGWVFNSSDYRPV